MFLSTLFVVANSIEINGVLPSVQVFFWSKRMHAENAKKQISQEDVSISSIFLFAHFARILFALSAVNALRPLRLPGEVGGETCIHYTRKKCNFTQTLIKVN